MGTMMWKTRVILDPESQPFFGFMSHWATFIGMNGAPSPRLDPDFTYQIHGLSSRVTGSRLLSSGFVAPLGPPHTRLCKALWRALLFLLKLNIFSMRDCSALTLYIIVQHENFAFSLNALVIIFTRNYDPRDLNMSHFNRPFQTLLHRSARLLSCIMTFISMYIYCFIIYIVFPADDASWMKKAFLAW